ncbi:4-diphosphocytidyl-2-C-methyl-D-erythritol kinase [alpha proteobacterium U9-1i]|nr:4-diphosphocytidyl-2-C-methyl-D-erythritol kinase [alpha proteobacterium U9-1i]
MIRVFAPAKINLTLKVGAPRADGMHPLASVVAFADVGDWVEAAPADVLTLTVDGPFASALEGGEADNLVLRAACALREAAGMTAGAALRLEKHLPIASGIGGGSSDAAAALKALNALWRLGLEDTALAAIAATLGADVPVCVAARAAYMTGVGEVVAPLGLPPLHAVLVNPLIPVPTGQVYRAFDQMGLGVSFQAGAAPAWGRAEAAWAGAAELGNDLFAPACNVVPPLADVFDALRRNPNARHVALSGSGGTLFALVADANAAGALSRAVARPDWWVRTAVLG